MTEGRRKDGEGEDDEAVNEEGKSKHGLYLPSIILSLFLPMKEESGWKVVVMA